MSETETTTSVEPSTTKTSVTPVASAKKASAKKASAKKASAKKASAKNGKKAPEKKTATKKSTTPRASSETRDNVLKIIAKLGGKKVPFARVVAKAEQQGISAKQVKHQTYRCSHKVDPALVSCERMEDRTEEVSLTAAGAKIVKG